MIFYGLRWMKNSPPLYLCLGMLVLWGNAPTAWAQNFNAQNIPAQQNPGQLTAPSRMPLELRDRTQFKAPPQDEIKLDLPERKPAAQPDSISIPLTQVRVEGITAFKAPEIQALISPYVGTTQTLNQLNGLVASLTELYRKQGYLTAEAFIPPQDIVDGVLTIQVQEGYIGNISIEGAHFYKARLVKNALSQKPGRLLNIRTLEKDLNRINRLSEGYVVKAFMSAGDRPGRTDIKIRMAEKQPFQIAGVTDNQGRPFIGIYRAGVDFRNDSVTGNGDRFSGTWRTGANTQVGMGSYTLPLNRFGTELSTSAAFSRVNVILPVQNPPDIVGKSFTTSITLAQPLDRDRHFVLDSSFMWSRVTSLFDGDQTSLTDVRALQTGLSFNRYDKWGRTFNRLQSTVALGGIGGTAQFWKVENYFNRVFFLPHSNVLLLRGSAQMTPDPLPSSQQTQIGGENTVRGYTEGLLIGDRGINLGIENRFPIPGLRRLNPWLGSRLQLALFYDYGRVWLDSKNPGYQKGVSTSPQRTILQGAGFGLRAQITRFMQAFIDVGFGLNNRKEIEPQHQPTARIHFGIRSELFPESYRMRNSIPVVYVPQAALKK